MLQTWITNSFFDSWAMPYTNYFNSIKIFFFIFKISVTLLLVNVHGISALCFIYLMSLFMPDSRYGSFLIAIIVQFIVGKWNSLILLWFRRNKFINLNLHDAVVGLCAYVFYWDVADNSRIFYYLLSLSPTFSQLDGISNIYTENKEQEYCRERCRAISGCELENMCLLIPNCCGKCFHSICGYISRRKLYNGNETSKKMKFRQYTTELYSFHE